MPLTDLLGDADAAALADELRVLGPEACAVLRREDGLLISVQGEETSSTRRTTEGCATESAAPGGRTHSYSGDCSATGLHRLITTRDAASAVLEPEPVRSEPDDDALPELERTTRQIADRILTGTQRELRPMISANATRQRIVVLRADGTVAADDRLHLELRIRATVAGAPNHAQALRVVSADSLTRLVEQGRHLAAADEVAARAAERVEAVDPPEGELPVVLGPGGPAALLHEVCGHGLEIDVACAPGAAYAGPTGRRVASDAVTVIDDPGMPHWAPLYRVDDEGHPGTSTKMIDRGVLTGYLADGEGSRRTGHPGTGNGRRLDHAHPALARMSCTYLAPGQAPREEALAGVRRGLYVRSIVAGETDMSGGEFTAGVTESHLIENGRITAPVRSAALHGRGTSVLRAADVVCDDLDFLAYGFQCNKLSQFPLTVSVGQPTVRIAAMEVSGA